MTETQLRVNYQIYWVELLPEVGLMKNYRLQLEKDVHATLASGGVRIHDSYICEYEKSSGQRAKIVVYEQTGKMKLKVCGLSLTMVASR